MGGERGTHVGQVKRKEVKYFGQRNSAWEALSWAVGFATLRLGAPFAWLSLLPRCGPYLGEWTSAGDIVPSWVSSCISDPRGVASWRSPSSVNALGSDGQAAFSQPFPTWMVTLWPGRGSCLSAVMCSCKARFSSRGSFAPRGHLVVRGKYFSAGEKLLGLRRSWGKDEAKISLGKGSSRM